MMSLADQLRKLATPVTTSYAPDYVQRKSLVYDDPSKVDTLLCYQESLLAFDRLCKTDEVFSQFRQTIFAETSCRLEMCTLFPEEKSKLDVEVRRLLCFVSPYLKHYDAIRMLEWLVHKFQAHLYYVEDLVRCVMPYHETGLFAKFLQLLDFSSVASEFRWLKPYAQTGKSLSRKEFVRACFREPALMPFISSMMLNALKLCKGLTQSRLNDLTNFFLSTMVALCDAGVADERLAEILDPVQHLIRVGLRAADCPPLQSATCLVVLRFALKLNLNSDLVLDWIACLLKKTRPSQTWEYLRVISQLMRSQQIAVLPSKLAARYSALLSTLPESQRKLIEREEDELFDQVDVNDVAAQAASSSAEVQAATVTIAIPTASAKTLSTRDLLSAKRVYDDSELLSTCTKEVDLAHAILAALPETNRCCLFSDRDPNCTCPKLGISHGDDETLWLSNLLLTGVLCTSGPSGTGKLSKLEVRRARRVLHFAEQAVHSHLSSMHATSPLRPSTGTVNSPLTTRSSMSKAEGLLEDGLDRALPLLMACLVHRASSIRSDAFNLLRLWFTGLAKAQWKPQGKRWPRLSRMIRTMGLDSIDQIAMPEGLSAVLSDQVAELLRGDSLPSLHKAVPLLVRIAMLLLLSEPLSRVNTPKSVPSYSSTCWAHGLQLLNDATVSDLFSIEADRSEQADLTGWSAYLELVRAPTATYPQLHSLSLSVLNAEFFSALRSCPLTTVHMTPMKCMVPAAIPQDRSSTVFGAQFQLLDSLCDLAQHDPSNYTSVATLLDQLSMDIPHFDYLLLKLDTSWSQSGAEKNKPLLARITEKREARRRITRQSTNPTEDTPELELISVREHSLAQDSRTRLRLLSTLLTILTESVGQLQASCSRADAEEVRKSPVDVGFTALPQKTTEKEVPYLPLCALITPLVNHLIGLLSHEQRLARTSSPTRADRSASLDSSDSDSETEVDETKLALTLTSPLAMHLDTESEGTTELALHKMDDDLDCPRTLLRQCCYRVLVCLTAVLSEANRHKPPKRRRPRLLSHAPVLTSPGAQHGPGDSSALTALVLAAVNPVFHCLSVFPDWHALHQQVLLCLIELANLCPVALSQRLISLIQWIANSRQFMRLDNVHNLALLGRLVVVAVPALIRSSTNQTKAGLQVLLMFVDGMPGLANKLPRRRLAFYTGLVRGLAQVTGPLALDYAATQSAVVRSSTKHDAVSKKVERRQQRELVARWQENWVGSWLWATSLVFLNRDWCDESAAEQVVPLLLGLYGQFSWDTQVCAWYECLAFLSWLDRHITESLGADGEQGPHLMRPKRAHTETPVKKLEVVDTEIVPPAKRRRTTVSEPDDDASRHEQTRLISPDLVCTVNFTSPLVTQSLVSTLFHTSSELALTTNSNAPVLSPASTWLLTGRAVQLLTMLLADPQYTAKIQQAANDPLGLGAVYGRLVEQAVQLMISASNVLTKHKHAASDEHQANEGAKEALEGLQKVLIQIHDSVTGSIFIRMISDLFESIHRGLRRKALELLAAKLTTLTTDCQPIRILTDASNSLSRQMPHRKLSKRRGPRLDLVLESGLVQFTAQLASQYKLTDVSDVKSTWGLFGSSFSRQSLACLRDLAKLLADRYPGEFSRTMDILITNPAVWWPVESPKVSTSTTKDEHISSKTSDVRGSGSAESRSLACLFFVECLQRLPWQSLCPEASATTHRLRCLVRFSLDHVITSCQLSPAPDLTVASLPAPAPKLVAGFVHSRDQHLQAGLTLLSNLMELAIVHRRSQSNTFSIPSLSSTATGRIPWLQLDVPQQSTTDSLPASFQLPIFIFRLSQLDLATVTGANPERSSSILRLVDDLSTYLRNLLRHIEEVPTTLTRVARISKWAQSHSDWTLLRGCLLFLREFSESLGSTDTPTPDELSCDALKHDLVQLCLTQPDLFYDVIVTVLEAHEHATVLLSPDDSAQSLQDNVHASISALLAMLPSDTIVRFLQRLVDWVTSHNLAQGIVCRLATFFRILSGLATRITAEDYSDISRQISLVDYVIVAFTIIVGQNRKAVRKLATQLHLKDCLGLYVSGTKAEGLTLADAALECTQSWLKAEHDSNTCLDVASSGGSVLKVPTSLIALLDTLQADADIAPSLIGLPPITETQLGPALDAFVDTVAGDEALLRPMGCALSARILHANHWRTRLAAIRLLKRSFDRLLSAGDQTDVGTAQHCGAAGCLVSDTLAALSEALEDDRPEVETEANRLFAELEQNGLTGNTRRTDI